MAKRVERLPEALNVPGVVDIYSLSNCISDDFADYITSWKHNGYWLFDSPGAIASVAEQLGVSLEGTVLFYYEVYELEFDQVRGEWAPFEPETSFTTAIAPPTNPRLEGFDVVSFFVRSSPECSPLSCNGLASSLPVNAHCLFSTLDESLAHVQSGAFKHGEPGPLRVFAVYSVPSAVAQLCVWARTVPRTVPE